MGLSSKKQTTTTTERPWVDPAMQANLTNFSNRTSDFLAMDPSQFVAPASGLQNKAFADVQNLGSWQKAASAATGMAQQGGNGVANRVGIPTAPFRSVLDDGGIQKFVDPQMDMYVNSALAGYDDQTGRSRAAMEAGAARNGAFGGSRYGVQAGEFEGQANRGRAALQSDLLREGFQNAANLAMTDVTRHQDIDRFNATQHSNAQALNAQLAEAMRNRQLQAASILGQLSSDAGANQRADVALTGELGAQQRAIATEQANALPTQLQIGANLLGAIPPQSYIGMDGKNVAKSNGGLLGALGSIAQIAGTVAPLIPSDRRLKDDVDRIGNHGPLGLYSYRYHWDESGRRRIGVMADEVALHAPDALGPKIGGYATVDYGKLGLAHLVEA